MQGRGKKALYCTLPEALDKVKRLEMLCDRMPSLYGYQSRDLPKTLRRLMIVSTSLSLVCMQADMLGRAFTLLKTAASADKRLRTDLTEQTLSARTLLFNSLAFLFEK